MTSSTRQKEYLAIRIETASPMELVRILYEGAVQSVEEAIRALHSGDILGRGQAINKAIEILAELRVSLRRDVEEQYSNTLAELYGYIQHQLISRARRAIRESARRGYAAAHHAAGGLGRGDGKSQRFPGKRGS